MENNLELVKSSDDVNGIRYKTFVISNCSVFNCVGDEQKIQIHFCLLPISIRIGIYFHDSINYINYINGRDDVVSKIKSEIFDKVFKFGSYVDEFNFNTYGGIGGATWGANFVAYLDDNDDYKLEKIWNEILNPYHRWVLYDN